MGTRFNIVLDSEEDLTPGDMSVILLKIRQEVLSCQTSGSIIHNTKHIGQWNYELEEDPI